MFAAAPGVGAVLPPPLSLPVANKKKKKDIELKKKVIRDQKEEIDSK